MENELDFLDDRKLLYIDMDGVVADFEKAIKILHPEFINIPVEKRADKVDELCLANRDIFLNLEPIPDAIDRVQKLMTLYNVYFLSTPMLLVPESFTSKRLWIEQHFGLSAEKRLILTHRKDLCHGDFLVDDRTKHGADRFRGKHIHFRTPEFPDWDTTFRYLVLNR